MSKNILLELAEKLKEIEDSSRGPRQKIDAEKRAMLDASRKFERNLQFKVTENRGPRNPHGEPNLVH
jgi:hypothetical protein